MLAQLRSANTVRSRQRVRASVKVGYALRYPTSAPARQLKGRRTVARGAGWNELSLRRTSQAGRPWRGE